MHKLEDISVESKDDTKMIRVCVNSKHEGMKSNRTFDGIQICVCMGL